MTTALKGGKGGQLDAADWVGEAQRLESSLIEALDYTMHLSSRYELFSLVVIVFFCVCMVDPIEGHGRPERLPC